MLDRDSLAAPGTPEREILDRIDPDRIPRHVAIIMDGNGRWAQARSLPRVEGHRVGIRAVRDTVETAVRLGVGTVTLYAFSTENWKRPRHEVSTLMSLLKEYIDRDLERFCHNGLRFRPVGRVQELDPSVRRALDRAVAATAECDRMLVQVALNYSGRREITEAARRAAQLAAAGELDPDAVDEAWLEAQLDTAGVPDPDLLIRTSGEQRISNFLLWQIAYAEIYFCPVLWPDFSSRDLFAAILEYQRRERRFGGLAPAPGPFDSPDEARGEA